MTYYGIDIGHNAPPDTGAMGGYEDELNKELATKVSAGLVSLGHDVIIVNPGSNCYSVGESLRKRCQNANNAGVDKYVSFHFNAFNGNAHGCETYYTSVNGYKMALPILNEICKLQSPQGQRLTKRGAKKTSYFQVLNGTNAPAVLVETCFCDNPSDMEIYTSIGVERVAAAIVRGLTGNSPKSNECK